MREKQASEAWKVLESAAKQPGTDAPMLIELAELYMNYARQMPGQKSAANRQTLALLNRADALHPTNATVRLRLADGFFLLGENERAAQCYLDLLKHCADEPVMRDNIRAPVLKQ